MNRMDHIVKVCCSGKCKGRGSDRILAVLERERPTESVVERTEDCMGYCGMGPNVAVNGNILHRLHPDDAATRIRKEVASPSPKVHGLGTKTVDDLDDILNSF